MNSTPNNNLNPLTPEEIDNLSGEELKKALTERLQRQESQIAEIDSKLAPLCDEVEKMPEVDPKKAEKEDREDIAKMETKLDNDLNDAVLDLATNDETLKDIERGDTEAE